MNINVTATSNEYGYKATASMPELNLHLSAYGEDRDEVIQNAVARLDLVLERDHDIRYFTVIKEWNAKVLFSDMGYGNFVFSPGMVIGIDLVTKTVVDTVVFSWSSRMVIVGDIEYDNLLVRNHKG